MELVAVITNDANQQARALANKLRRSYDFVLVWLHNKRLPRSKLKAEKIHVSGFNANSEVQQLASRNGRASESGSSPNWVAILLGVQHRRLARQIPNNLHREVQPIFLRIAAVEVLKTGLLQGARLDDDDVLSLGARSDRATRTPKRHGRDS